MRQRTHGIQRSVFRQSRGRDATEFEDMARGPGPSPGSGFKSVSPGAIDIDIHSECISDFVKPTRVNAVGDKTVAVTAVPQGQSSPRDAEPRSCRRGRVVRLVEGQSKVVLRIEEVEFQSERYADFKSYCRDIVVSHTRDEVFGMAVAECVGHENVGCET